VHGSSVIYEIVRRSYKCIVVHSYQRKVQRDATSEHNVSFRMFDRRAGEAHRSAKKINAYDSIINQNDSIRNIKPIAGSGITDERCRINAGQYHTGPIFTTYLTASCGQHRPSDNCAFFSRTAQMFYLTSSGVGTRARGACGHCTVLSAWHQS